MKSYLDVQADKIFKDELESSKRYKQKKKSPKKVKKKKKSRPKKSNEDASGVYFKCPKRLEPSFAENRISKVLDDMNVLYHQEVMFVGFISDKGGVYRFDFYLPKISLIIEYDGETHNQKDVRLRDDEKNRFCKEKELTILRFNKSHWKDLEQIVKSEVQKVIDENSVMLIN